MLSLVDPAPRAASMSISEESSAVGLEVRVDGWPGFFSGIEGSTKPNLFVVKFLTSCFRFFRARPSVSEVGGAWGVFPVHRTPLLAQSVHGRSTSHLM